MKSSLRSVATPAVLALLLIAAPAWAQTSPTPVATSAATATNKDHGQKRADAVERRIADLHTQLKITDQQAKPWDAFAQTMRDNAQKADQAFRDRSQKIATMSAVDAMKSYADITQMHADNMKKLSVAFSDLYAVLSPEQKQIADTMYRNPHGHMDGSPHKGGKSGKGRVPASTSSSGGVGG